jgi:hypothetical protein
MGRSITPPVRVEVIDRSGYKWQTVFPFSPTHKNFVEWINTFDQSVLTGVNKHLGPDCIIASATLVSQRRVNKGEILQSYTNKI